MHSTFAVCGNIHHSRSHQFEAAHIRPHSGGALLCSDDFAVRKFSVDIHLLNVGWVGTPRSGFHTIDGGKSWSRVEMGRTVNKVGVLPTANGFGSEYPETRWRYISDFGFDRIDSLFNRIR